MNYRTNFLNGSASHHPYLFNLCLFLALVLIVGTAQARSAPESFATLAEKLLPSVVNISTTQVIEGRKAPQIPQLPPGSPFEEFFKEFFDRQQPQNRSRQAQSLGSGFIIGNEGHVVTNNHVIQDADEITVILQDDTRLNASLIGRDARTDLAVLKIDNKPKFKGVKFGDSSESKVGDWIVAIGNPFGLGGTVTAGIISARGRNINAGPYDDFIQTDASINRGNSGGPMFNMEGEVIGINTAIFSPSGGSVGIGFAIPSASAEPVIRQLIKNGEVQRGWLGVHIQQVTEEIAERLGLKKPSGALVASLIPNGPAAKANIQPRDIILSFNGKEVQEMRNLPKIVADTKVGDSVDVIVWRNNSRETLKVTVGMLKDKVEETATRSVSPGKEEIASLGLTVATLTEEIRTRFNLSKKAKGVVIIEVDLNGPSAKKGLSSGDLIVEIGQEAVATAKEASKQVTIAQGKNRKSILLYVEGKNGPRFVAVRFAK